jgi:hypothetical protein
MSPRRYENAIEGPDAESRVANLFFAAERGGLELSDAVNAFRWAAQNWLHARKGVADASKLTPDADMLRVLREALEVQDNV